MNTRILSLVAIVPLIASADRIFSSENDLATIKTEIAKRHDEAVKRLQDWIRQVSIAAEDRDIRKARSTWRSSRMMPDFSRRRW